MKYTEIPYIFKYLTRFIYHPDKWVSGDTPTKGLSAFKVGDTFRDFHFDTSVEPQISDFTFIEAGHGFKTSIIAGLTWDQDGDGHDIETEGFAAEYIPAGTDTGEYVVKNDVLMIIDFEGYGIYYNAGAVEFFRDIDHRELTEGWQTDSLKDFILNIRHLEWNFDEPAYGRLLSDLGKGMEADYTQVANGKLYGFKKEDYYTPQPVSLVSFELGQTVKPSDKIKFDLTADTSVIDDFLNNLDYDKERHTIRILIAPSEGEGILSAYNGEPKGFDSRFLVKDMKAGGEAIYYSTKDITDPESGITINKGWQPHVLENNGVLSLDVSGSTTLKEVYNGDGWNGVFVGYVEGEPEPQKTVPFANGDILNSSTKIHFDTTKVDEFADYLNSLVYLEHMPMVPFFIGIEDQSSLRLTAAPSKSPEFNIPIFSVGLFGGEYNVMVFAADDIYNPETGEKVYSKGFQNLDEDGNLLLDGISGDYVLELFSDQELNLDPADWNNIFISRVDEPGPTPPGPTPTLTPFELGQTVKGFDFGSVSNGDTNSELDSFLNNLPEEGECVFVCAINDRDFLLCGKTDGIGAILAIDPTTEEEVYLYATEELDDGKTHFYKGYQNLTDGKYIYPNNYTINIQKMNINIEDTSWNGRLIGAVLSE